MTTRFIKLYLGLIKKLIKIKFDIFMFYDEPLPLLSTKRDFS
jgi:hypothetical protein